MQIADLRCRSVFYTALGRLMLINLGEDEDKFEQFMIPLTGKLSLFLYSCIQIIYLKLCVSICINIFPLCAYQYLSSLLVIIVWISATFESIGNALAAAESGVFNETETKV